MTEEKKQVVVSMIKDEPDFEMKKDKKGKVKFEKLDKKEKKSD